MLWPFENLFFLILFGSYLFLLIRRIKIQKETISQFKENGLLIKNKSEQLKKELNALEGECAQVESDLNEVQELYHAIKKMGEVLGFAEMSSVFIKALYSRFPFEKGVLALAEKNKIASSLGNIYGIKTSQLGQEAQFGIQNAHYAKKAEKILEKCFRSMSSFAIEEGALFSEKGVVLPLWAQGECVGFLGLEVASVDLDGEILEILVNEFSLEIKKKMLYEKVKALSVIDSLTGVYLRKYFFQQLELEWSRCLEHSEVFSLLLVDMDGFKKINDQYGHLIGDELLKQVGFLLTSNSREIDLVGRYGGDEFVIMLPSAGIEAAEKIKQRILDLAKKHSISAGGEVIEPSLSIGMASFPKDGSQIDELISIADERLYKIKEFKN